MTAWTQYNPTRILFGAGVTQNLGQVLADAGYAKALLIADPFMVTSGKAQELIDRSSGRLVGVFSQIDPNPTIHNVNGALKMARDLDIDAIVALGGGSALDAAKATAAGLGSNLSGEQLVTGSAVTKALPLVAIPTTAGTGSEVTPVSILSWPEESIKFPLGSPLLYPALALVDPSYVYTAPASVIAASGVDVISHCLDAISSTRATPLSDSNAVHGARLAFANLERAVNEKAPEAIDAMMLASLVAGLAFSQTGTTGSHAASYFLTSQYGIAHGEATAFTQDAWIQINAKARPQINALLAQIGFKDAADAAAQFNRLKKQIHLRTTLGELGIPADDINLIAQKTLEANNWPNNVARLNQEEVEEIFRAKL